MANAYLAQFRYSYEKNVTDIFLNVTIGATGAPTLNTSALASSKGVVSITRNGVGEYTILLKQPWIKLLNCDATVQNATGIGTSSAAIGIVSGGTNVSSVSAPTVQIQFSGAGAAVELASGSVVYLQITVSNSSAY